MIYSSNIVAPCIYQYNDSINFSESIIELIKNDVSGWRINNQDATDWQLGDKILGYDEYEINFNFLNDKNFLLLGKAIFDVVKDYSIKNLTSVSEFNYCNVRKYSTSPAFLELESADVENPYRKVTSVLFLNTIGNGGELKFKNFDISIPPSEATMIVFPSSFAYSFRINKPKDENSFILISHFV